MQDELLARMQTAPATGDATKRALTGFFRAIQANPGVARVFLIDLDDHGGAMRMASFDGARKLSKAFGLKAAHPLMLAGIVGAHCGHRQALDRKRLLRAGGEGGRDRAAVHADQGVSVTAGAARLSPAEGARAPRP